MERPVKKGQTVQAKPQAKEQERGNLDKAIQYLESEFRRLGVNKRSIEVLALVKHYGYLNYESLDLDGMRRLYRDLRTCEPSDKGRLDRSEIPAEVRSFVDSQVLGFVISNPNFRQLSQAHQRAFIRLIGLEEKALEAGLFTEVTA